MDDPTESIAVEGRTLVVTHPDKCYWPDDGLRKRDMVDYYRRMAPVLLPYFRDRPVTLHLFPRGIGGPSFYRRSLPDDAPDWLRSVDYVTATHPHRVRLPVVDDAASLLWLANLGAVEFHLWASRAGRLEQPDWAIFDLDPGEGTPFERVLHAALALRERLEAAGWRGVAKTSGGRGVHVYVPLSPGHTYEAVRARVRAISDALCADHPELFAPAHGSTHTGDRVTIDAAQNGIGRNTAAPYTLRARPGAPVSTPLRWEEVERGDLRPGDFTLRSVPDRVREIGDPFAPVLESG